MDRQEFEAFMAQLDALDAKLAAQVERLRERPSGTPAAPPSPPVRAERLALWRIAMLCKAALSDRAVRPELHPYFVQIARVCREVVQREDGRRGTSGV